MAKNDWFVAGLNNPDLTTSDFVSIGDFNTSNTQFLKPEEYLKSDAIKNNEAFKDDKGNFSKSKFDEYYKKRVNDFGELQESQNYKGPALSAFDINRTDKTPIKKINFSIKRGINPDRQMIGIEGVNRISDPEFSKREIAEQNKIFDFEANKFMDHSVNEHSLFSNPIEWIKDQFKDPLVLATWDSDGEHVDPITGIITKHKKGENKLNEDGTYYYETLGGRSVIGKDVLAVGDTLTVDGEGINKYDFFDSDDIKKSTLGIIAKNAAAIAPLFMGDWISGIYSAATIARELSKAAPMIAGWVTSYSNDDVPSWVNTLSAIGQKYTTSTSDYAKENSTAFENTASMIADIAMQWGQQKFIAESFNKLRGASSLIKDAELNAKALYEAKAATMGHSEELWKASLNKFLPEAEKQFSKLSNLGQDASLVYMAITSNTGIYNDMLEAGATKREAAAVSFGSTLGMFAFDKYTDLGKIFFDDETAESVKVARKAIKNEFEKGANAFKSIIQSGASQNSKYMQLMSTASDTAKRALSKFREDLKYHTLGLTGKMLGEGLEEVGEEAIGDVFKSIYELAGALGADTSVKDVKAFDNAGERYFQSFIGGALGASVFYGVDLWNNRKRKTKKEDEDLATLIRNGHVEEVRTELNNLRKEGKLGDKNLSSKDYELDDNGNIVWRTTDNVQDSQQEAVFNMINDKINAIEEILVTNNANLSDDELFDNLIMQERRFKRFENIAPITNYYQDFSKIVGDLVQTEMDYKKAANTIEGTADGTVIPNDTALSKLTPEQQQSRQENLEKLKASVESNKTKMNEFLSGDTSLDYVRKLNFAMDPSIHEAFLALDQEAYFQKLYPGKSIEQLSPEETIKFLAKQWPEYVQTELKANLDKAWNTFKDFEQKVNPHLKETAEATKDYTSWRESMENLINSELLNTDQVYSSYKTFEDQLDGESDEDFNSRNTKKVDPNGIEETDEEFNLRKVDRLQKIIDYNNKVEEDWIQKIKDELVKVNYNVDPVFARQLIRALPESGRMRTMLENAILLTPNSDLIKSSLSKLNTDLSNLDDIRNLISKKSNKRLLDSISEKLNTLRDLNVYGEDGYGDLVPLEEESSDTATIKDIFEVLDENGNFKDDNNRGILEDPLTKEQFEALKYLKDLGGGIENQPLYTLMYFSKNKENLFREKLSKVLESQKIDDLDILDDIIQNYKKNPLFKFQEDLKKDIKNPIGELIKKVAKSNNDEIPDIDNVLNLILKDYQELKDISELELNDAQYADLEKAKNYMKMLQVYIRAASTSTDLDNPIGHNKSINEFAANHKDQLRKEWDPLPEISSDYATYYYKLLDDYVNEIETWLDFSNKNKINKIAKFSRIETALTTTLWKNLSKLPRVIDIDDDKFDILEGIETIDASLIGTEDSLVPLFSLEKLINANVKKWAENKEMSVSEFLDKYSIFEKLIPGLNDISTQKNTNVTDKLTEEDYTDYDKFLYLNTVISEDPSIFYESLKNSLKANSTIAPIITQELASRIAKTSSNPIFRENFNKIAKKYSGELPILTNTTISFGVAGAGKTQVVLGSIDRDIKNENVLIAGPKRSQADAMQKAMNRNSSYTFEELFKKLLGEDTYNELKNELKTTFKSKEEAKSLREFKYFSAFAGSDGLSKLRLKEDALEFKNLEEIPKAIYIDEATHLSTVEVLILDAYARSVGSQVYLLGDPSQRGYFVQNTGIDNIEESSVFAVRTPKLTVSLRDANLQKFQNQENVRALLDTVLYKRKYDSSKDYKNFADTAKSFMKSFNFRVYDKTELNGDFIVKDLSETMIKSLKDAVSQGKTIAFIGDSSSTYLHKLKEAGIDIPSSSVLDINSMQGQEFDYVVIDHKFTEPLDIESTKEFLQELYTLMTRAREASIFVDYNLSKNIGVNVNSPYKSKAPSIRDGVEKLIENKLKVLDKLDFSKKSSNKKQESGEESAGPGDKEESESTEEPTEIIINSEEKFKDPEVRDKNAEVDLRESAENLQKEDQEKLEETLPVDITQKGLKAFPIQAYGDAISLGVNVSEVEEKDKKGNTVKRSYWKIDVNKEATELRNLQALLTNAERKNGGISKYSYNEKIALQKRLFNVHAALKYNHSWDEEGFPIEIKQNFTKEAWETGTYELEFREVGDTDVKPIHSHFKEIGMQYGDVKIIASIVFKVKNQNGQTCIFDLAGINSPQTLINNREKLKESLTKAANKSKIESERTKLLKIAENVIPASEEYEKWFNEQLDKFIKGGKVPYSINVSNFIEFDKTTWFDKRTGPPIRLDGYLDPRNPKQSNVDSLVQQNPRMVFSSVYTFTKHEAETYGIDPSISGKAVVFVSDDVLLNPKDLVSLYLEQKRNPESHTPRVRMLMLNNFGMTFSQMINEEYLEKFKPTTGERKPFRQNFVGIRMFTSMWNTRAALLNFNTKFKEWLASKTWSDNQLKILLEAHYIKYKEGIEAAKAFLDGTGLTSDNIDEIDKFNNEVLKDVPMFRLGYSTHENQFHIQRFLVDSSSAYPGLKEANLAAITPEKALQFYNMLNAIMQPLIRPRKTASGISIGLGLNISKDSEGNDLIKEDQYIDLEKAKHKRTLSGLLDHDDETMTISYEDKEGKVHTLAYAQGDQWSLLPKVVSNLVKKITALQRHPSEVNANNLNYILNFSTKTEKNPNADNISVVFDISEFFEGDSPLLKPSKGEEIDESLWNLLDLMFHGTTDDIHKKPTSENPLMQLTDAYFKQGFLINPDISRAKDSINASGISGHKEGSSKNFIFFEISTNPGLFLVDVDLRTSGIRLNLHKLMESSKPKESIEEAIESTPVIPIEENTLTSETPKENTELSLTEQFLKEFGDEFNIIPYEETVEIDGNIYEKGVPENFIKFNFGGKVFYLNFKDFNSATLKIKKSMIKKILEFGGKAVSTKSSENIEAFMDLLKSNTSQELLKFSFLVNVEKNDKNEYIFTHLLDLIKNIKPDENIEVLKKDGELFVRNLDTNTLEKIIIDFEDGKPNIKLESLNSSEEILEENSDKEEPIEEIQEEPKEEPKEKDSDNNKKEEKPEIQDEEYITTKEIINKVINMLTTEQTIKDYIENNPDLELEIEYFNDLLKLFYTHFDNKKAEISSATDLDNVLNEVANLNNDFENVLLFLFSNDSISDFLKNC